MGYLYCIENLQKLLQTTTFVKFYFVVIALFKFLMSSREPWQRRQMSPPPRHWWQFKWHPLKLCNNIFSVKCSDGNASRIFCDNQKIRLCFNRIQYALNGHLQRNVISEVVTGYCIFTGAYGIFCVSCFYVFFCPLPRGYFFLQLIPNDYGHVTETAYIYNANKLSTQTCT